MAESNPMQTERPGHRKFPPQLMRHGEELRVAGTGWVVFKGYHHFHVVVTLKLGPVFSFLRNSLVIFNVVYVCSQAFSMETNL